MFIRTCQSCGHKQEDSRPIKDMAKAYKERKCKKCKSPDLDYGSEKHAKEQEDEDS